MEKAQNGEDETTRVCKICQSSLDDTDNQLSFVHPCKCKGSIKYIHEECLNEWISLSKKTKCEICGYSFQFKKTFKPNTPQKIPATYVILFFLKKILEFLLNALCSILSVSKAFGIFILNFYICKFYLIPSESARILFIETFTFMSIGVLQSVFIKKTINTLSMVRARISNNEVLENLLSEVSTRNDSVHSQLTAAPEANSESNDLDDQAVVNNFASEDFVISSDILFRRPTLGNLKQDLILALSLSHVTVISALVLHCSKIISYIFGPLDDIIFARTFPKFFSFCDDTELTSFYLASFTISLLISLLLIVLNTLKSRTSIRSFKTAFYVLKVHTIIILTTIFTSISIGCIVHFTFSYKMNNYIPIFKFHDSTLISICIHMIIGGFFTFLIRETYYRLSKKFRPGFLVSPPKNSSYTSLIEISSRLSFKDFIVKSMFSFCYICFIPCSIILIALPKMNLSFAFEPTVFSCIHFKTVFILGSNASNIAKFFAQTFSLIAKLFSSIFNVDNYIYNRKTPIPNKLQLVWSLNIPFTNNEYLTMIDKINSTIKEAGKFQENNTKTSEGQEKKITSRNSINPEENIPRNRNGRNFNIQSTSRGTNIENPQSEEMIGDLITGNESENLNEINKSVVEEKRNASYAERLSKDPISTFTSDIDSSELVNYQSSFVSSFDYSSGRNRNSKTSQTLIKSIQNGEMKKILDRYEINDRRIAKYYGVKHNRRISIFYRPSNFVIFKSLWLTSNFIFIQLFFYLIFKFAYLICQKILFKTEEFKSVSFVYLCALILSSLCKLTRVLRKENVFKFKAFLNPLILTTYTNFVFPFATSIANVVLFATNQFTAFSYCFIILFSFSEISHAFFKALFIVSPIDHYSPVFILKQILLFFCLKVIFLSMYLTYNRIIILTSMYPFLIFTFVIGYYIYKAIRLAFVGSLMDNIKDYFFLDKTEVINYESNDE